MFSEVGVRVNMGDSPHKNLDGSNSLERDLSFPRSLPKSQNLPQLLLAHRTFGIDLIPQHQKGNFGEILDGKEGI